MPSLRQRVLDAAGVDDPWERPRPEIGRQDVVLAASVGVLGLLSLELVRSSGGLDHTDAPVWAQWLVVLSGAALLLGRRRWPLVVAILAAGHMFVAGVAMPQVMGQLASQIVYFVAILSGVAWARDRRAMLVVIGSIIGFMFAWLCWQFVVGSAVQDWYDDLGRTREGVFAPIPAAIGLTMLINGVYFGGAVVGGLVSWRSARQRDHLAGQAATIARQAERLREQAVMDERLRIARELHDVVAHHVSAMGIQAGAARRVLDRDADAARQALTNVEEASRDAVTQMRRLLGTLREGEVQRDAGAGQPRTTEAGVDDLPGLVAEGSWRRPVGVPRRRRVTGGRGVATPARRRPGGLPHGPGGPHQRPPPLQRRHRLGRRAHRRDPHPAVRRGRGGRQRPTPGGHVRQWAGPARYPRACRHPRRSGRDRPPRLRWLPRPGPLPARSGAMTARLRVLLVDDHAMVRSGFAMVLSVEDDVEVVGQAADGLQAIELARATRPDVVLMDVQMPRMDGIEATRQLVAEDLGHVVILTTFDRDDYLFDALDAGASGFLLKNAGPEQLLEAVRAAGHGHALLAPEVTRRVIGRRAGEQAVRARPVELEHLTAREHEVLVMLGRGLSNAEIADELVLGEATVKTHVSNVLTKLHLRDRVQAVIYAYEAGLILPAED